jgi:hypothetical protein
MKTAACADRLTISRTATDAASLSRLIETAFSDIKARRKRIAREKPTADVTRE